MKSPTRSTKKIIFFALCGALMFTLQLALSPLPNVELVSLFVILLAVNFGWQSLIPIYIFVLLEGIYWSFGIWWIGYLYVWTILACIVILLRKYSSPFLWAVVAGGFGLLFGTLCSPSYFITGGWSAGIGWIVSGLLYDIIHAVGNLAAALLLFSPLQKVFQKYQGMFI